MTYPYIPALKGSHWVTSSMSYPVIALSHFVELSPDNALCNSFSWGKLFPVIASFSAVVEPPCRDHYIPSFVCQQCPYSRPPGELYTVGQTKLNADFLKCEQGAGGVRSCAVFSEPNSEHACGCLDFFEGWLS